MAKQKFYRTDNIDKTEADYRILLGERSNGKSYAVKEKILKKAYDTNRKFIYLRRWDWDFKHGAIDSYFADMPIEKITHGDFDAVVEWRREIYFAKYDKKGKPVKGPMIGRALDLNGAEHYKSQAFPDYDDVIYEEFVSQKSGYIPDEPHELMNLISTIARRRRITVWMIANTISRVCPYFQEWQLTHIPKQEQGTIDVYHFDTDQVDDDGQPIVIKVAVEYCENSGNNTKMIFGNSLKSIAGGSFTVREYPHHPLRQGCTTLYSLLLKDMGFTFVLELKVTRDGGFFVFVHPKNDGLLIERVITSEFSPDPLTKVGFSDKIKAEMIMRDCLKFNKVCFSDNLTGTDFEDVLKNRSGGTL